MVRYRFRTLAWLWILGSSSLVMPQAVMPQAVMAQAEPSAEPTPEEPGSSTETPAEGVEGPAVEAPAGEVSAEAGDAVSAEAAPEEAVAESAAASPDDDIIVTGSRIKTSFGGSAAPVEVIDRKALARTGATNLPDLIATFSASQGSGPQGSFGIGASGGAASSLNLRGLGPTATLILLNGRRLTPSAAGVGLTDLSAIPFSAVERIEILKAGAAAIYGADAVAGVVNIITRRNLDGMRVALDGTSTTKFDHGEYTASASVGSVSTHSRVLAAASYFRRTELTANERDFPADKYVVATKGSNFGTFTPIGGMAMVDPACPANLRTPVTSGNGAGPMATSCAFPYRDYISWFPNVERANAFASGQFDLGDHAAVFGELVVSRYRGDNIAPRFNFNAPFPTVPANHVDNPYGVAVAYEGRPVYGTQTAPAGEDMLRGVVGLNGDLGGIAKDTVLENWNWELSASIGSSRFRQSNEDNVRDAFQAALNSCSDPLNLSKCFNPFYSAVDGSGTPNTDAVIKSFAGSQTILTDSALQTYNAGVAGPLFALPGGDLGLAFGGEIRHESRSTEFDHDSTQQRYGYLVGNANFAASRSVYSGYLELRWPLLRGIELQTAARVERYTDTTTTPSPFAALTLSVGDLIGRDKAPSALQNLTLRANVARAFRAPNISDTAPGFGTAPQILRPATRPDQLYVAVQTSGNPDLKPETAITASGGLTWAPFNGLNLTADYWYYDYTDRIQLQNATQVLAQSDMLMGMDPNLVELDSAGNVTKVKIRPINSPAKITTSGIDFALSLRVDGATFGGSKDDFGEFNVGASGTYTIDYTVPRSDVPRTALGLPFTGCDQQWGPTPPPGTPDPNPAPDPNSRCNVVGHRNPPAGGTSVPALPRIKANLPLSWTLAGHSIALTGHYISGFDDDSASAMEFAAHSNTTWIPSQFTLDVQYGFSLENVVGKRVGLRVGALNVFDAQPPTVFGPLTPYEGEVHDPRGRMVYAKLDGEF